MDIVITDLDNDDPGLLNVTNCFVCAMIYCSLFTLAWWEVH